jgi:hypothetical protein
MTVIPQVDPQSGHTYWCLRFKFLHLCVTLWRSVGAEKTIDQNVAVV